MTIQTSSGTSIPPCGLSDQIIPDKTTPDSPHIDVHNYKPNNKNLLIWSHGTGERVSILDYNNASLPPVLNSLSNNGWNILTIRRSYKETSLLSSYIQHKEMLKRIPTIGCDRVSIGGASLGAFLNMYYYLSDARIDKMLLVTPNAYDVSDAFRKIPSTAAAELDDSFQKIATRIRDKLMIAKTPCTKFLFLFFESDDIMWKNGENILRSVLPASNCVEYIHDYVFLGHSAFYSNSYLINYQKIEGFLNQ